IDVDPDFVGCREQIDLTFARVVDLNLLTHAPYNAVRRKLRLDLDGRLVIYEVTIDDGFPIAVRENRCAEDLGRVEGWRGGEADFHRIEVVEHAPVLRDVFVVAAKAEFRVR